MKKYLIGLMGLSLFALSACGSGTTQVEEDKNIVVGFGVGTYEEQFRQGILPILEDQGYSVEIKTLAHNNQVNPAMADGSIDVSIFQSIAYMEGVNDELNIDMTAIAFVPSAPQSLHSERHTSLEEVSDGTTVALPDDPVNQERAVRILEDLGWVIVDEDAGTIDFDISQVHPGDYDIDFKILDPAQILVSLPDVDYGVINGNYIADSDKKLTDSLKIENTPEEHRIIVSILKENEDTQWAQDIKAAYESQEFEDYILSQETYDGFIFPEAWENN